MDNDDKTLINEKYVDMIDFDKRDYIHDILLRDIYYFYFGIKVIKPNCIKCRDNNKFNVSKTNLYIE